MRLSSLAKIVPLKLHTRTTIVVSAVLVAVFIIIAYFSDLAITKVSDQQEQQQAQLLAAKVSDTVEHHIKKIKQQRKVRGRVKTAEENEEPDPAVIPDWADVQEEIVDLIVNRNPQLAEIRIFHKLSPGNWEETVRWPADAEAASQQDRREAAGPIDSSKVSVSQQGQLRTIVARAPIEVTEEAGPAQIGTASVLLAFDERQSYAAALRSLIWPLMLLAIVAITLITYFLFRHIVYNPIDNLLLAMSKAEEGNLAIEVPPASSDEIGLLTSRFNRMLGRIRNVTEQLNLEQRRLEDRVREATGEIAERKEQLEEANLRLFEMQRQLTQLERLAGAGQLAAQFAHEVGTPLNLISGHVQLLRARATDDRVMKRLDVIEGQIERITGIVRSMLDSTKRPAPQLEPTDVNLTLARILDASQPTLVARNVQLRTRMTDGLPLIDADSEQLQQVFINLINNSLDAMPEGGNLEVSTRLDGESVLIELCDDGEGIREDQLDLVFDPFFSTKQGRGTGLGLTIVKQIVSEHAGTIDVESRPGKWTAFRIRFPVPSVDAETLRGAALQLEEVQPKMRPSSDLA